MPESLAPRVAGRRPVTEEHCDGSVQARGRCSQGRQLGLGQQQAIDVQLVVSELIEEGLTLYLLDAGDLGDTTPLYPAQCKVLVKAEEADRAREAFIEAGFLEA